MFLINNVSYNNKGDALMVEALVTEVTKRLPQAVFAVPYAEPNLRYFSHHANLRPIIMPFTRSKAKSMKHAVMRCMANPREELATRAPRFASRILRLARTDELRVIFDISGFALSDHWGVQRANKIADAYKQMRDANVKIILLPKTFGPFTSPEIAEATRNAVCLADRVFCRDRISFEYLTDIVDDENLPQISLAPDYTTSVMGAVSSAAARLAGRPVVIPNTRMTDKTPPSVAEAYPRFLAHLIRRLRQLGQDPFFLLHQTVIDLPILNSAERLLDNPVQVVAENDHRKIKGIIGNCNCVISSRLHGIINGLSQAVPTLGTGWSHKYQMVFEDYNCREMLIDDITCQESIDAKITRVFSPDLRMELCARLASAKRQLTDRNAQMWDSIVSIAQ